MIELPKVIRDFTAFLNGVSYAGRIDEATIPDLDLVTQDQVGGGTAGTREIWMGLMAKMLTEITMTGLSAEFTSALGNPDTSLTLLGDLTDGGESFGAEFEMRGLYKKAEFGNAKREDKGSSKGTVVLTYFKATIGGKLMAEVDIDNKLVDFGEGNLLADSKANLRFG